MIKLLRLATFSTAFFRSWWLIREITSVERVWPRIYSDIESESSKILARMRTLHACREFSGSCSAFKPKPPTRFVGQFRENKKNGDGRYEGVSQPTP